MLNTPSVFLFFFLLVTFCCEQSSLSLDLFKKKKSLSAWLNLDRTGIKNSRADNME